MQNHLFCFVFLCLFATHLTDASRLRGSEEPELLVAAEKLNGVRIALYSTHSPERLQASIRNYVELLSLIKLDKLDSIRQSLERKLFDVSTEEQASVLKAMSSLGVRPSNSTLARVAGIIECADYETKLIAIQFLTETQSTEQLAISTNILLHNEDPMVRLLGIEIACTQTLTQLKDDLEATISRGGEFYHFVSGDFATLVKLQVEAMILCGKARLSTRGIRAEALQTRSSDNLTKESLAASYFLCETEPTSADSIRFCRMLMQIANDKEHNLQAFAIRLCLSSSTISVGEQVELFKVGIGSNREQIRSTAMEAIRSICEKAPEPNELLQFTAKSIDVTNLSELFRQLEFVKITGPVLKEIEFRMSRFEGPSSHFLAGVLVTSLIRNVDGINDSELLALLFRVRHTAVSASVREQASHGLQAMGARVRTLLTESVALEKAIREN